jgi:hypothetical protein
MTNPEPDPRDRATGGVDPTDDSSIVPGLGPSGPLDMSKDPDRYDPTRDPLADAPYDPTVVGGPLDRSLDPDRYRPPGQGQTLTDLLGEGAHEDKRDNAQWAWGLLSILAFLAFVSWFFTSVATP